MRKSLNDLFLFFVLNTLTEALPHSGLSFDLLGILPFILIAV